MTDFGSILEQGEKDNRASVSRLIREKGDDRSQGRPAAPTLTRLRTMEPQDSIDLHGLKRDAALASLEVFISNCVSKGLRKVAVVTGKGIHSEQGAPVLRQAAADYLNSCGKVSRILTPPAQSGGSGVLWVILKGPVSH